MARLKLYDDSGDKKYFLMLPHFILNHSTANDQALYCQMKRYAGEDGECYATEETLRRKLGIGGVAYRKSLKYLLDRRWITHIGMTKGKTRPINTYKVNDIWQENMDYYKKILSETGVSPKRDTVQKERDTVQNSSKILSRTDVEEEPCKEDINNKICDAQAVAPLVLKEFEAVNPAIKRMYGNTTQRDAVDRLVNQFGLEVVLRASRAAIAVLGQKFAPRITTPYQLEEGWAKLVAFLKENKNQRGGVLL